MPRECGWCSSPNLGEWEGRIESGDPVAVVSIDTPYSVSAARRHVRLHMQPRLRGQLDQAGSTLGVSDFADRLLELADQTASVGEYAYATNNGRLALHAIQQERDTLIALMSRLGIESGEAAQIFRDAKAVMRALSQVLSSPAFPGAATELARVLRGMGNDNLARAIAALDQRRTDQPHGQDEMEPTNVVR